MADRIGPQIGIDGEKAFRESIRAINAEIKALGTEMQAVTAAYEKNESSTEALAAKNDVLSRSLEAANSKFALLDQQLSSKRQKLQTLGDELERTAREFGESSDEALRAQNAYNAQYTQVAKLEQQYQQARLQIEQAKNAMADIGTVSGNAARALSAADIAAANAAWDGLRTAINAVGDAMRNVVQTGIEFDSSISSLAATMGTTVNQVGQLRDFAQEMGATTAYTANEAAQALNYMALAGYDAQQSMTALPNVLNLAAAGTIDLASASDMVTDAQSALGLSMEQSAEMIDQMAKTSTKTNSSVAQLGEALLTVGGTAKYLSGGTAEINQVLGVLADNSIKGAEGGTKLRNIILSLASPTEKASKTLNDLGVSLFDAQGNMRSFSQVFPELNAALSDLTSEQQLAALGTIFNNQDIAAAQALLGTTVERWRELDVAIQGAAGAAEEMAKTKLDNLAGDITLFQSAVDGASIAITDALTPALRDAAQAGTGLVSLAGDILKNNPVLVQAAAGLTAGIAALTVGIGAMSAASAVGITSLGELAAAISLAAAPVAPFALAVGGLVTAITMLAPAMDEAQDKNLELLNSMEQTRAKYEETSAAFQAQNDDLMAQISALEALAAVENKTALEKETMLSMVEALNAAVPGLSLTYNEWTDSLNLTADAIRDIAQAELDREKNQKAIERYKELLSEEEKISQALAEAKKALAEAEKALAEARARVEAGDYSEDIMLYYNAVELAGGKVDELTAALEQNRAGQDELADQFNNTAEAAEDAADAIDGTGSASSEAREKYQNLIDASHDLEEGTLYIAGAMDSLTEALKEQEQQGALSVATTESLIDAGYGAALAIDEETGAVTLDEQAYINLTAAQYQCEIAEKEMQKAALDTTAQLLSEKTAAEGTAGALWNLAAAAAAAKAAEKSEELSGEIEKLKNAQKALNNYAAASTSAARAVSRSSGTTRKSSQSTQKEKTQAEKELEAYKTVMAELDHLRAMDQLSDEEYYRALEENRDKFLISSDNLSEYRKASEELYKYQKSLAVDQAEEDLKVYKSKMDEMDHLRAIGQRSDEEYYAALKENRDRYLSDPSNLSDYRKATEELYKYEQSVAEESIKQQQKAEKERFDALKKQVEKDTKYKNLSILEQYQAWVKVQNQFARDSEYYAEAEEKAYDLRMQIQDEYLQKVEDTRQQISQLEQSYQQELEARAQEIENSYGLFERVQERSIISGDYITRTLRGQLATMEEFYGNLDVLSQRGAPEALVEEIRSMGVQSVDELAALVKMSDKELENYAELFSEKQKLANDQAEKELRKLREETEAQIQQQIDAVNDLYEQNAPALGLSFAAGVALGIEDGMSGVVNSAVKMAQSAVNAVKTALGKNMALGLENGMEAEMPRIRRDVEEMMTFSGQQVTPGDLGSMLSQAVNAIGAVNGSTAQPANITIQTRDGIEIARAFLPDIRAAERESPQVVNDG